MKLATWYKLSLILMLPVGLIVSLLLSAGYLVNDSVIAKIIFISFTYPAFAVSGFFYLIDRYSTDKYITIVWFIMPVVCAFYVVIGLILILLFSAFFIFPLAAIILLFIKKWFFELFIIITLYAYVYVFAIYFIAKILQYFEVIVPAEIKYNQNEPAAQ